MSQRFSIRSTVVCPEALRLGKEYSRATKGNYVVQCARGFSYGAFPTITLAQLFVRALDKDPRPTPRTS